jgi:diguanylate cyclase (GGDEF)-like protein
MMEQTPLSLCLIDGDELKRYNNKGYEAGDDVIRKLSATLSSILRPDDFLGRWRMGDEFIVILPSTTNGRQLSSPRDCAPRSRIGFEGVAVSHFVSIGIACHPKHGNTANELLEAAEIALKTSKQNGKNCVSIAP